MSAWVPNKAHIDAMVTVALAFPGEFDRGYFRFYAKGGRFECAPWSADELGQLLTDDVVTAVGHRYPDADELPGDNPGLAPYAYEPTRAITDGEAVELMRCYAYQACEHNEWAQTFAHAFVEAVEYQLLSHVKAAHEAAHGKTKWGYEREDVRP